MTDKQLDRLVRQKVATATKLKELREKLDPEIEARYGTHPGEVDCDSAIDALDYGLDYETMIRHGTMRHRWRCAAGQSRN